MKCETKLKCRSDENPPQAKDFNSICHSRILKINEIINDIEIQEWRKPAAGEIFYDICHSRTQVINEILCEIEIHEWRKLAAGEIFYNIVIVVHK